MGICSGTFTSNARLDGKTAIVTGANTGIGYHTAKALYQRGSRVILACRNMQKAKEAIKQIKEESTEIRNVGELDSIELDLTSLQSVRICAAKILDHEENINLLINNAGIMMHPKDFTADGYELQFGTNHLGHFLFTLLLLPKICNSTPARIINVSSVAHKFAGKMRLDDLNWKAREYDPSMAYYQSKLANILFSTELVKRLNRANVEKVTVYSVHPGVVYTELGRYLKPGPMNFFFNYGGHFFAKTPEEGAQTQIYCAVDEGCANETGLYYADCAAEKSTSAARNEEDSQRLWEESLKMVGLANDYDPFKQ